MCRAVDVVMAGEGRAAGKGDVQPAKRIHALKLMKAEGRHYIEDILRADVFVETTGSAGPMGNCARHGSGCAMCILRCPAFGPRVSLT